MTNQTPLPFHASRAIAAARPRIGAQRTVAEKTSFTPVMVVGDPEHARANAVFFGDNAAVMRSLAASEIAGAVDLVYIDPPFNTGRAFKTRGGLLGYSDIWASEQEFLAFLHERLVLLRALLSQRASFYLHIPHEVSHVVRVQMDDAIGRKHWRNEITRTKSNPKNMARKAWGCQTDVIQFYSYPDAIWNDLREPLAHEQIERQFPKIEPETGRRFNHQPVYGDGVVRNGATGQPWRDMLPPFGKHWVRPPAELEDLDRQGRIYWTKNGTPRVKYYADESPGNRIQDVWNFKDRGGSHDNYPTEKNLELLERIVQQSSAPGSIVLDCFMGSGTTLVAAARNGRRFVGIDESRTSLAATTERLTRETGAAFTVFASEPLVEMAPGDGCRVERDGGQVRVTPQRGDTQDNVRAVLVGHRRSDGVWQTSALRADGPAFVGGADDNEPTHALLVHESGAINAVALPASAASLSWTTRRATTDAPRRLAVAA